MIDPRWSYLFTPPTCGSSIMVIVSWKRKRDENEKGENENWWFVPFSFGEEDKKMTTILLRYDTALFILTKLVREQKKFDHEQSVQYWKPWYYRRQGNCTLVRINRWCTTSQWWWRTASLHNICFSATRRSKLWEEESKGDWRLTSACVFSRSWGSQYKQAGSTRRRGEETKHMSFRRRRWCVRIFFFSLTLSFSRRQQSRQLSRRLLYRFKKLRERLWRQTMVWQQMQASPQPRR